MFITYRRLSTVVKVDSFAVYVDRSCLIQKGHIIAGTYIWKSLVCAGKCFAAVLVPTSCTFGLGIHSAIIEIYRLTGKGSYITDKRRDMSSRYKVIANY